MSHLVGVVQHAGQQGGHELGRVVALEVGGLVGDVGIAGRVALVEGVGGEAGHLVVDLVGDLFGDAVGHAPRALVARLGAAVDEVLPLGLHDGVLFLAHGAADVVRLPEGEAGQLPEDLHHLLLIDDAAVGDVQDMGQLRGLVADLVGLVAVAQVGGDGLHRAGAVKADEGDDVLEVLGLQAHQHLPHPGGFELEHALGLAAAQHLVGGLVVVVQPGHREGRVAPLHRRLGVPDDGEGAQAQEIHLEQAELFDLGHVELGDRQPVVGGEGQVVVHRLGGDDHARRVGGGVARHPLHLGGGVDQLFDLRVGVVHLFQLGGDFQRPLEGHLELHRHLLCHRVHALVGQPHHPPDVPDGVAGGHGAEGDDLSHMVGAVLAVDIVDDLLPALVAEVDVEVGHADPLGVQKPLEDQLVADGVDVGDADAVGRDAARARPAPGAHRDVPAFGVVDIVVNDEVVVGVPHALDDPDLVPQPLFVGLGDVGAVAALQPLPAELLKVGLVVHPAGGLVVGDLGVAEVEVEIALLCDLGGVGAGLRHHREQLVHLLGALEVELVGLELHPVGVLDGLAGLDAEQDLLHPGVLPAQVVGVVGGRHRDAGLPRQPDQLGQHRLVLGQAVVLQFNVVAVGPEQVPVPEGGGFGPLVIAGQQGLGHLAGQAGRQADQPLVVLFQQLLVHPGLGVKALGEGGRHHLDQVLVAGLVFAQQDQVVVAVHLVDLVEAGAGGHIDLAPDDGLDAGLFGRLVKLHAAVHHPVVGAGDGGLAALSDPLHQPVDPAGAVQQAVLGVDVQMDKALRRGGLAHGDSPSFRARRPAEMASSRLRRWASPDLLGRGSIFSHNAARESSG